MKKNILIFSTIVILLTIFMGYTFASPLDNNVKVTPDTDLTYYLKVKYDGVDISGNLSSDASVAEVYSDTMYISDKLPDGLIFDGFVESDDGTIGAYERNNPSIPCLGKVIDDTNDDGVWSNNNTEYTYHGLHYNKTTNTVSFKVKNLKAGCQLNVGIKTKTPLKVDNPDTNYKETRRDFYNFASLREKTVTTVSNLVHAFMGVESSNLYNVSYEYTGTVPDSAIVPITTSYMENTSVSTYNISAIGYTFNGWTSDDVTIQNGKFTMPNHDVVIKGSFTENSKYQVSYNISGTIPDGYVVPASAYYYNLEDVTVDSLKVGDIIGNYKFNGWVSSDVDLTDEFVMPNKNVTITGSFSNITHKVSYKFSGNIKPDNSDELLPSDAYYEKGANVVLPTVNNVPGYVFLGWNMDDFVMDEEDVTVYGQWKRLNGTFEPTITKTVINPKPYYHPGDIINYKITVTNTANYAISNVMVKEDLPNAYFQDGNGYTHTLNMATISNLNSNSSIDLYSTYVVSSSDTNTINNATSIVGASALNYYELANQVSEDMIVDVQSKVTICTNVDGTDVGNKFLVNISNNNFQTSINMSKNSCLNVYLTPGTYNINEIIPQEYNIKQITGLNSNGASLQVVQGQEYNVTFVNEFRQKGFMHAFGRTTQKIDQGGN